MTRPAAMPLMRSSGFFMQLKKSTMSSTVPARPRFSKEPKLPSALAPKPPPKSVMPTCTRLRPMSMTTTPLTVGVMTFFR